MTQQPEALRLADELDEKPDSDGHCRQAAAELRRLHAVNAQLLEALEELDAKPEHTGSWLKARAAIAKATGEQA